MNPRVSEESAGGEFGPALELLSRLYVLVRNARTHHRRNSAMVQTANAAEGVLRKLLEHSDSVRFDVISDCVFFNSTRIRTDITTFNTLELLVREIRVRGIRAIIIEEGVEAEDLISFAVTFASVGASNPEPFQEIIRKMRLDATTGIQLLPREKGLDEFYQESSVLRQNKEQAKRAFFSALGLVREAVRGGIENGSVNPRKVKRVVESVVDSVLSDEQSMLALTYMQDYDQYTYCHSLDVCIYTIALANRLGVPKANLCEMGIAALFHDIGKTQVPVSILNQSANLTHDEWEQIRKHTAAGVQVLTCLRKLDKTVLRAMVVTFCHHMNIDQSGYPATRRAVKPDTVSKIVRIADVYDALTSARAYRVRPFTSAEALEVIRAKAGKELDPVLCSIFANVVAATIEPADDRQGLLCGAVVGTDEFEASGSN